MTKKEFDKLTKENMRLGKGHSFELRHHYRTRRGKPSPGTTALNPNEFFGKKEDPFHRRINRREPMQHGVNAALRAIGSGRGNEKLRDFVRRYGK